MQVRTEIEVLPADEVSFEDAVIIDPSASRIRRSSGLNLGWTVQETIGVAVVNTRAISKLSKNVVVGE
jgi:hypothetical protein